MGADRELKANAIFVFLIKERNSGNILRNRKIDLFKPFYYKKKKKKKTEIPFNL